MAVIARASVYPDEDGAVTVPTTTASSESSEGLGRCIVGTSKMFVE